MKRFLLIFFFISTVLNSFSKTDDFSRWSITAESGYNLLNWDINQDLENNSPTSIQDITFGGTIEYALTPVWGLSLDGFYFPLRATSNTPVTINIHNNLYNSDINSTINFTRWIFPNTTSKIQFNGSIGIGYAYYTYDLRDFSNIAISTTDTYTDINHGGQTQPIQIYKDGVAMTSSSAISIPITFSLEYNFSKPLAIGAKIHYRAHSKGDLEGATPLNWDGASKDYIAATTLFLRLKFNSINKSHLRNIVWDVYEPEKNQELVNKINKKVDDLAGKVDTLAGKVDTLRNRVDSIIPRLEKLEKMLSNNGPDSDNDGVPDARDLSPNTPTNTPVDFWGKPLSGPGAKQNKKQISTELLEEVPAVYFGFDQIELNDNALVTIQKIARVMKADPTLIVEVRGYCDYMGNNPYNNLLSQRRSDRVKSELMKVWEIPFDHIISNGKGKIIEPRIKYSPNRRCDFFFGRL